MYFLYTKSKVVKVFWAAIFCLLFSYNQSRAEDERPLSTNKLVQIFSSDADKLAERCTSFGNVILHENIKVMCLVGSIESNMDITFSEKFDVVFAKSGGGEVLTAMKIGQEIHEQEATLVVSGFCLSSCANYIIPAAKRLVILKDSYVGFHGTPPRDITQFRQMLFDNHFKNTAADKWDFPEKAEIESQIEKHKSFIHAEVDYFLNIGVNELFAISYHSKLQRLKRKSLPKNCRVPHNIYHILGPEHLEAYGLRAVKSWFPSSKMDFDRFIKAAPGYSYVYDMDDFPFYVSGVGHVESDLCLPS